MGDPARALEAYERALRLNPVYLDVDAPAARGSGGAARRFSFAPRE